MEKAGIGSTGINTSGFNPHLRKLYTLHHMSSVSCLQGFGHFNADQDPAFHFNADPDPDPQQGDAKLRPLTYRLQVTKDPSALKREHPAI
jgi:hypothetical protein